MARGKPRTAPNRTIAGGTPSFAAGRHGKQKPWDFGLIGTAFRARGLGEVVVQGLCPSLDPCRQGRGRSGRLPVSAAGCLRWREGLCNPARMPLTRRADEPKGRLLLRPCLTGPLCRLAVRLDHGSEGFDSTGADSIALRAGGKFGKTLIPVADGPRGLRALGKSCDFAWVTRLTALRFAPKRHKSNLGTACGRGPLT